MKTYQNISQFVNKQSKKNSKKIAVIFEDRKISYEKLEKIIFNLSISFYSLGIKKGDKVAIVLSNSLEFVYIMLAAAKIGAVIVPYNISLPPEVMKNNFLYTKINFLIGWHKPVLEILKKSDIGKIIKKKNTILVGAKIKGFHYFDDLLKKSENKIKILNKQSNLINNDYIVALTSGSTGDPKPIVLSQKTKILRSIFTKNIYNLNSKSVIIASTPLYHTLAQRLVILSILLGGTLVIMSGFSNKKWFSEVKRNKVTFAMLVSSQLENLINFKNNSFKNVYSLKSIVASSSKLHENIRVKISKYKKPHFYEIYGTSEIAAVTNLKLTKNSKKIYSVGKPIKNASVKIINNKNIFLKKGNIGEIVCKTPLIFSGYLNKKKETRLSFYKNYFKTGDMGYLDKDNYLYYTSRKKNIIIVGGINVYPEDIERILKKNNQVRDCSVFGINSKILGEQIVVAIVKNKKELDERRLRKYSLKNLADYQQPHYYFPISILPVNSLGKIDKNKLINSFLEKKEI